MTLSDGDVRSEVVARVRSSLPEFAERNHVAMSDRAMDNLAQWVVGVIPSGAYRSACPVAPDPCACMGECREWARVGW